MNPSGPLLAQPVPASTLPRPTAVSGPLASRLLGWTARGWWAVALLGQGLFAAYVVAFYGRSAWLGQFEQWNKVLPNGWAAGQPVTNTVLSLHLLFTVVVVLGGALQLLPWLRRHAPRVHHWNGRVYLLSALLLSVGGLVLVWTRPGGELGQHLGISLNALLIIGFTALAWRAAVARRFGAHQRWALRLLLAVSGVWFFRIGLMAWLMIHQAPVGFDPKTFTGPFLVALSFAQALLPLAVLELVFIARRRGGALAPALTAGVLLALTLLTALGIVGAFMMMWAPRMVPTP